MNTQESLQSPQQSPLPSATPSLDTEQLRQQLACLIDPQAEKSEWFSEVARDMAIRFCAALPSVFGSELDRMTMWDKIAAAIQGGYAKTVNGDLDLFVQHVLETIKAEPARVVASERFVTALDALHALHGQECQDWLEYLATHLIPMLVHARREHKLQMEAK